MRITRRLVVDERPERKIVFERVIPNEVEEGNELIEKILNRFSNRNRYHVIWSTDIVWGRPGV